MRYFCFLLSICYYFMLHFFTLHFLMLRFFQVGLLLYWFFSFCTLSIFCFFDVFHSNHTIIFSCCTLFSLHSISVAPFSCFTLSLKHSFDITLFVLRLFCCTLSTFSCYTLFLLWSSFEILLLSHVSQIEIFLLVALLYSCHH